MLADHVHVQDFAPGALARIDDVAEGLAAAVDAKALYKPSHCNGVARLAMTIGAYLGLEGAALRRLRLAGLMHDVGKLHVPDEILNKPGTLTAHEWQVIREHPVTGHDMLMHLGLPDEARWVLHHHERGDGSGYPSGLAGDAIPAGSRILLVADAFDVMVSRRVYKAPMRPAEAVHELRACIGVQFDREIVEALAAALQRGRMLRAPIAPDAPIV